MVEKVFSENRMGVVAATGRIVIRYFKGVVSAANGGTWGWTMVYCEGGLASFSFLFGSSLSYFLYYVWGWTVAHMFGLSTRLKCYCDSPKKNAIANARDFLI